MTCGAYEGEPAAMRAALQPLADWADAQGGTIKGSAYAAVNWNKTTARISNFSDKEAVRHALPPGMIECVMPGLSGIRDLAGDRGEERRGEESRAEQSRGEEMSGEHSRAEESRAEQRR